MRNQNQLQVSLYRFKIQSVENFSPSKFCNFWSSFVPVQYLNSSGSRSTFTTFNRWCGTWSYILGIVSLTESCYRNLAYHLSDNDIDALSCTNKKMRSKMTSDSIWRLRFERRFCRDEDEKLKLASNWKQLYKWQCCEMLYSGKPSWLIKYVTAKSYSMTSTLTAIVF